MRQADGVQVPTDIPWDLLVLTLEQAAARGWLPRTLIAQRLGVSRGALGHWERKFPNFPPRTCKVRWRTHSHEIAHDWWAVENWHHTQVDLGLIWAGRARYS